MRWNEMMDLANRWREQKDNERYTDPQLVPPPFYVKELKERWTGAEKIPSERVLTNEQDDCPPWARWPKGRPMMPTVKPKDVRFFIEGKWVKLKCNTCDT